jgi:putative Mg2+ transporter-C (MgtC) family protein
MISPEQVVLRLVVAAVLGGLVGLERERLEWAAGMRTHALVSLGSALFMVVSIFGFSDILAEQHVILDPSRVAAQVASGIGFIGAGTIILRREVVKGLTTRLASGLLRRWGWQWAEGCSSPPGRLPSWLSPSSYLPSR